MSYFVGSKCHVDVRSVAKTTVWLQWECVRSSGIEGGTTESCVDMMHGKVLLSVRGVSHRIQHNEGNDALVTRVIYRWGCLCDSGRHITACLRPAPLLFLVDYLETPLLLDGLWLGLHNVCD